jgi:hypothetical protein
MKQAATKNILKPVILLLIIFAAITGKAQENRFYIGVYSGITIPMGQFAKTDFYTGGYALTGFHVSAEGGWYLMPNLAVTGSFSEQFYRYYKNAYLTDLVNSDNFISHVEMKTDMYQVRCYMIGALYRYPVTEKLSLDGKLSGGMLWAQTPDQFIGADYYLVGSLYYRKTPSTSLKPAGLAGIDVNYKLFDHVVIRVSGTFSYSKADFTFVKTDGTTYTRNYTMPLVTAGCGMNITF